MEIRRVGHSRSRRLVAALVADRLVTSSKMLKAGPAIQEKMAENEHYLSVRKRVACNPIGRTDLEDGMKLLKMFSIAALLLLAVSVVSAQNTLPDPNDSTCWQSLEALRTCAQAQYDREAAQAQRCTSYPEYQCEPESEQLQTVHVAHLKKQQSTAGSGAAAQSVTATQSHQAPTNSSGNDAVVIDLSPAN